MGMNVGVHGRGTAPIGGRALAAIAGSAVALLLSAPAFPQEPVDADALFARGVQLHQGGDVVGAIEAYEAALAKDPGRVDARSNLGAAFAQLGRYDEAVTHYRTVLARVPQQAQVRFNLALALYKAARIPEAADELEKVVAQEPGHRNAVLLLANCRAQTGNQAAVVSLLSPREEEFKDDRLFAYLLGSALLSRNELMRGQAYIDRLFQGGETAEAHVLMGVAHLRRRDYPAALPELERAVQMSPDLRTVHSLLGRILMGMGRREEAIKAFRRELEKDPNDFDANVYIGLFLKEDGRLDEADAYLSRAGRLRPQDPAALYALGALHIAVGRLDDARRELESVTAQVPGYRQAHVLLASVYYRQQDKRKGDHHRDLAEKLRAEQQALEPGAADDLGPAYRGPEPPPPPARADPARGGSGGTR
jgi:tetratricopeptide (TPR) repeat protein